MTDETHPFEQVPDVSVRVCACGKWPDHHVHTGDRSACGCDEDQAERARAQQRREDLIR